MKVYFMFIYIFLKQFFILFSVRDRARKARARRADKSNLSNSGDLTSLIDEISSRGNSICSDLSTDQFNINDHHHVNQNSFNNHHATTTPFHNNPYSNTNSKNPNTDLSQRVPPTSSQNPSVPPLSTASHLFTNDSNSTYPNQPPPPVYQQNDSQYPPTSSQSQQLPDQANSFFNSADSFLPQPPTNNTVPSESTLKDNFHGYQSVEPQQQQQQQNYSVTNNEFLDSDNNVQEVATPTPASDNSKKVDPQGNLKHDYFEPNRNDKEPQQGDAITQPTPLESSENFYAHYGYSGPEYQQSDNTSSQRPSEIQSSSQKEETQSAESSGSGSSGSGSSYAMVPSVKSLDSDPRLSPYQFVENAVYPSQSSLNSNESSPLDIQNVSTASATYDKVSIPSMSSFEITGSSTSSDQIPLYSTSSVVEAIEEAIEPIEEYEPTKNTPAQDANPVQENKKLFQKAAALFEEAKRTSLSSSESPSMENHSTVSIIHLYAFFWVDFRIL